MEVRVAAVGGLESVRTGSERLRERGSGDGEREVERAGRERRHRMLQLPELDLAPDLLPGQREGGQLGAVQARQQLRRQLR